jgi:hypothetical protein
MSKFKSISITKENYDELILIGKELSNSHGMIVSINSVVSVLVKNWGDKSLNH